MATPSRRLRRVVQTTVAKAEKAAEKRGAVTAAKRRMFLPRANQQNSQQDRLINSSSSKLVNICGTGDRPPAVFSSPKAPVLKPRPIGPCFRCGEMVAAQEFSQYPHSRVLHVDESIGCGEHRIECSELFFRYWEFMEVGGLIFI